MNDIPAIVGSIKELRPITPRDAVQQALFALDYIEQFGFLAQAIAGNEMTGGAQVLHRELGKARALLVALLTTGGQSLHNRGDTSRTIPL